VPGLLVLALSAIAVALRELYPGPDAAVLVAGLLTLWSACIYLATGWRGRIFGETRARVDARTTVDPLTGLSTQLVLGERVRAARILVQRYGHPSVLLLVHIENLPKLAQEFGPEVAESAVLVSANRIRQSLRDGDVAARLTHSRVAVLVEGLPIAGAAANVASRILVAGLKEPLPAAPAEFLHFRIVLAAIPVEDLSAKQLLHRLNARLDSELQSAGDRRIVTVTHDELLA
jgi:diguanylate cyclase (GGDEF)-like protein